MNNFPKKLYCCLWSALREFERVTPLGSDFAAERTARPASTSAMMNDQKTTARVMTSGTMAIDNLSFPFKRWEICTLRVS